MSDVVAAVGELAQGALTARALEPSAGEGDGHTHEAVCLNCGTDLIGPHCYRCGQRGHVHRTLSAFFHDLLHGVFHFEGKTWRTLPLLVWRPGKLTREYIDGRRASYVSPIALFLFVVFLTFAGFHALGGPLQIGGTVESNGRKMNLEQGQAYFGAQVQTLERRRAAAIAAGRPVADIDQELAEDRQELTVIRNLRSKNLGQVVQQMAPQAPTARKGEGRSWSLNDLWRQAKANPDLLIYRLESDAYKFSWLLIPISVPFVWLLFPFRRQRFPLYDHTVFVTYSLSFMMLAMLLGAALQKAGLKPLTAIVMLYLPAHMYRQLRGAYGVSRFGAVVRTLLLMLFAGIALTLWALAIVALILGE